MSSSHLIERMNVFWGGVGFFWLFTLFRRAQNSRFKGGARQQPWRGPKNTARLKEPCINDHAWDNGGEIITLVYGSLKGIGTLLAHILRVEGGGEHV